MITFGFLSIVHVSALAHEWQYFTLPMTSNISLTPQKLSISFPFEIVFSFLSKILTLVINLTYFTKERKVRRWSETCWRRPDHTKCPDWSAPGQKILASTMKLTGLADCNRSSFFYPLTRFYVFVGQCFQCFPGNQKYQACLPWPAKRVG